MELRRYLRISQPLIVSAVHGGVVFILWVLFWMVSHYLTPGTQTWLALLVVPLLIILATTLVGMSWSWDIGRVGLVWGSTAALSLLVLASAFGASQLRSNWASELWMPPPTTIQSDLLVDALKDIALQQNGRDDVLEIISLVEDSSLRWVLRGFRGVQFTASVSQDVYPDVLITMAANSNLAQLASYRGQDFVWYEFPGWEGALPPAWFDWLDARKAPVWSDWVVMWARSDLFPGDSSAQPNVELPSDGEGIK